MEGVTRICAHSQALAQCQVWLNQHYPGIERQAVASNGEAARIASEDPAAAAIAGEIAGQRYNLGVVKAHVQDGVLTITLAKAAKVKPRRVKLTTGVIDKVKGLLSGGKDRDTEHESAA